MVFLGSSASAIDSWVRHWEPRHDWSTWRKNASTNVKVLTHVGAIIQHNPVKWMLNGNVFVAPKQSFRNSCQNVHFEIWSYHDIGPSDRPSAQGGRDWCFSGNNLWAKTVKIAAKNARMNSNLFGDVLQPGDPHVVRRKSRLWTSCPWNPGTVQFNSIQTHTKSEMKQRLLLAFLSNPSAFLWPTKNDPNSKKGGFLEMRNRWTNNQSTSDETKEWHPKHQLNQL